MKFTSMKGRRYRFVMNVVAHVRQLSCVNVYATDLNQTYPTILLGVINGMLLPQRVAWSLKSYERFSKKFTPKRPIC